MSSVEPFLCMGITSAILFLSGKTPSVKDMLHISDNCKDISLEASFSNLVGIENFRFRKMVFPGDTLILKSTFISPIKRGIAKMKSEAFVGDNLVSEGIMTATIVKNNDQK